MPPKCSGRVSKIMMSKIHVLREKLFLGKCGNVIFTHHNFWDTTNALILVTYYRVLFCYTKLNIIEPPITMIYSLFISIKDYNGLLCFPSFLCIKEHNATKWFLFWFPTFSSILFIGSNNQTRQNFSRFFCSTTFL